MAIAKGSFLLIVTLAAGAACFAQQKFPLRPGEWEVTTTFAGASKPFTVRLCLNDQLWTKALAPNKNCTIQNMSMNSRGVNYLEDCPGQTPPAKGRVALSYEGKEHMTGKAFFDTTKDGVITTTTMVVDYRWKGPECNAEDVNLRQSKPAPSPPASQPPGQPH